MGNFDFLKSRSEFELFADAAIEAERVYASSPAMCAVGCRKALELAVKWMYCADTALEMPYNENIQALIHEPSFRKEVGIELWHKLPLIIKLGNIAIQTKKVINKGEALNALEGLFEFIKWLDFCYGEAYIERDFDAAKIPTSELPLDVKKIKEQKSLIVCNEAVIDDCCEQVKARAEFFTGSKSENVEYRHFLSKKVSEFATRKCYIDVDLTMSGWTLPPETVRDVEFEYAVEGMMDIDGQPGFVDYVLFGKDGRPLALVEAKRTSKDPNVGKHQARLYADCLEKKFGRRPMIFLSNGFETHFWDDKSAVPRVVSGIFSKDDLEKLMERRENSVKTDLLSVPISDEITGRYYQKEAIRAVCEAIGKGLRKHLLVMATGTGKTRTAASLVDVLSRAGKITNVLFLADRNALVNQADEAFYEYVPRFSRCRIGLDDDLNSRIVSSTYPSMLNKIDEVKTADSGRAFTPAHFDLIIVDESHRSIFKKYRAIFDYFDAQIVGLTATPRTDVDVNTYDFFELERGVPTYNYDYETAVYEDRVLVPFYNYEVRTKFLSEGIHYDELSEEDQAEYRRFFEDFGDEEIPEWIPPSELNTFLFAKDTVDKVFQDLMERGIKVEGGDKIGKTIIFAQNTKHAQFIIDRFDKLYPEYNGSFAARIVCADSYANNLVKKFKEPAGEPQIAVSVDMLDTGVDVPECVNLVFFKRTYSKIKFEQMLGRGTRLCKELSCVDGIDGEYTGKRRFMVFDYCGNFEFFRKEKNLREASEVKSLTEKIFSKRIDLISALQCMDYADSEYQNWRAELVNVCRCQVDELNTFKASVRQHLAAVEKFKKEEEFADLSSENKIYVLKKEIAPLVFMDDMDEFAKRFDNLVYGLMLATVSHNSNGRVAVKQIRKIADGLYAKGASIPQISNEAELIKKLRSDDFWNDATLLSLENVRRRVRELVKFLDDGGADKIRVYTSLVDHIIDRTENIPFMFTDDTDNYKAKVNRYIMEHKSDMVIYKLTHNEKLTRFDFKELERIFTEELGSKEDYAAEYGDTPFGLLVRKIAHLDHEAAEKAFSQFINDGNLSQAQIAFVKRVINYVEQNGYMENMSILMQKPFDRPNSIVNLFDRDKIILITNAIKAVGDNAVFCDDSYAGLRAAQP